MELLNYNKYDIVLEIMTNQMVFTFFWCNEKVKKTKKQSKLKKKTICLWKKNHEQIKGGKDQFSKKLT